MPTTSPSLSGSTAEKLELQGCDKAINVEQPIWFQQPRRPWHVKIKTSIVAHAAFGASLDDEKIAALHLRHDTEEGIVDERVQRGVVEEVVSGVDLKAFMRGDWRSDV